MQQPPGDLADELDVDEPALHGRVPPLRTHRPRLPRPLLAFVDACLEPEPQTRPTIADAVHELGRDLGLTSRTRRPAPPRSVPRPGGDR